MQFPAKELLIQTDAHRCIGMYLNAHWNALKVCIRFLFWQKAPIDYLGIIDFLRSTVKEDFATNFVEQIGTAFSDEFSIPSSSIHLTLGMTTSMTPKPATEHERKYMLLCVEREGNGVIRMTQIDGKLFHSAPWLHWVLCKHECWAVHMHIVTITCVISVEFQCAIKLSIKWMLRL